MPLWIWIALSIPLASAAIFFILLALTARQSTAGIVTSRLGRTLRLFWSSGCMMLRYGLRTIRRTLTSKARRAEDDRRFHEATARAALETMGNMKGALMKLGQIASFMDETLPEAYQEQLRKLQTQAPPMSYDTVARVIRDELGADPERLFARFDEKPLASASIGQVHRAALADGTEVVVKVQYPGVDRAIAADLGNAGMILALIGAVTPTLDAAPIAEELRARLLEELDYTIEAKNQQHFIDLYCGHATIVIPRVFLDRSSRRVLTTEFLAGHGFYDFVARASADEKRLAVHTVRDFALDSIWFHNVFNGDPHPGNYIFMGGGRVGFLDFGCVKHFDPMWIGKFKVLNRLYLLGERDEYFRVACDMGFIKPGHENKVDRDWLWEYARWFYMPILEDKPFRFTAEYNKKALSQIFGENMRLLNMPAEYVLLNRITFGLNSILSRLGACENWRTRSLAYYFSPDEVRHLTTVADDHVAPPTAP